MMRTSKCVACGLVALAGLAAAPAMAQHSFVLEDANSLVHFNTDPAFLGTRIGMDEWRVDGVNHMFNQWFWFRVGNTAEQRINALPRTFFGTFNTNADPRPDTFTVQYTVANSFQIESSFRLTGGNLGSGTSDVLETIRITNQGTVPLDFHFFQYCDLDLNNDIIDDSVRITAPPQWNTATQIDGAQVVTETSALPFPNRHEVNTYANTINSLDNATATNLNNNPGPLGPPRLDYTWAFQWDFILNPGDSFLISKDKLLTPAPGTLGLLGLAGVIAGRRRRR